MNPQFKKRVQAAQQSELGASAAASDEHSATRNHHTLPPHLPGLVPSSALYSSQIGRTTGGAIRTSVANVRAARSRGVPGIPAGAGVVRTVLGHSAPLSSTATISTPAANVTTASPRRAPTPALATGHSTKRATRTDGSTTTLGNSLGTIKKTKAGDAAPSGSLNNISNNNSNAENSNNIHSTRSSVSDNSNSNGNVGSSKVVNSTESVGSVVNQNSVSSEGNSNKNNQVTNGVSTTTNLFENFNVSGSSTILRSPGMKSPSKKIVFDSRKVRTMTGHSQRVGVLAWSDHTLTSGSRDRNIYHRDVRSQEMWQHCLAGHHGEVCGLKWNSSGTQLASGGNDNKLLVWEKDTTVPLYRFRDHTAAVKAIDWSPHQSGLLASGGGTADQHIRFWNTATGVSTGATNTGSQVCNLAWSRTTNELVSTHGYSQNQIFVWKYPAMQQIAMLTAHTYRVLYLALSPDGQTIVTGAGDETLRFWNVFQKSKSERRDDEGLSSVVTTIR
ncbi:substrate-specific activator of APC-dependent proteolysis [Entomortierella chlamydospora]|uniref:Substrate-specific activator of APC-dependent proteolysis n=1 Tax=Entomortierella chlamydospora TaxID=101097 RepID=A0A9P6MTQ9_9FUNG|nr:substrate-specific activator of APC-dependent proteolysis [Entomortierella chlamydospora]